MLVLGAIEALNRSVLEFCVDSSRFSTRKKCKIAGSIDGDLCSQHRQSVCRLEWSLKKEERNEHDGMHPSATMIEYTYSQITKSTLVTSSQA